ncbi:MAG: glycosyltransferase [Saprospiraceae bacterium]|nr:glycosyltransferase [Candidatus Brachybacter algidus]
MARPMDIFGGLAAIIAGIPFVAIERTDPMRFKDGIKYFLRKCITRKAKGLIANSNQGKTFWKNILSENIKIERLPNIIDFENISSVKPVYEESFIVYVGRIHEDKNVIQLINAFSHVVVNYSNLNLYIIGEGELINQCKLRVQELKINNSVKFLGYVNPPYEYIKSAGIFISLSSYEGMPNTVITKLSRHFKFLCYFLIFLNI